MNTEESTIPSSFKIGAELKEKLSNLLFKNKTLKCTACHKTFHYTYIEVITKEEDVYCVCKDCIEEVMLNLLKISFSSQVIRSSKQDTVSSPDNEDDEKLSTPSNVSIVSKREFRHV